MRDYREIPLFRDVTPEQWNDWRWQLAHRITGLEQLKQVVRLVPEEEEGVRASLLSLRMAITPYYATLVDPDDPACPVRRQAVPSIRELERSPGETDDPLHEDVDSPVPGLTHRYPDRVLFLLTDQCFNYCRHCTRKRLVGVRDRPAPRERLEMALEYIRGTPEIRDVLLSGGDPLTMGDGRLEWVLTQLRRIPHVEVIRIGTRAPVVVPMRITPHLCRMLARFHPVWVNTHFNHPRELTPQAQRAVGMLVDHGIPVGNQTVLLKGINDCPVVMRDLVRALVRARVRPYYIYQCDLTWGLGHFRTSIRRGLEIMEMLRGHVSGFAVPTYVVDAPGGGGKIPLSPQYLLGMGEDRVILRNFEGVICAYREPAPSADGRAADGTCPLCGGRCGELREGLGRLMYGDEVVMEPADLPRARRRSRPGEDRGPQARAGGAGEGDGLLSPGRCQRGGFC